MPQLIGYVFMAAPLLILVVLLVFVGQHRRNTRRVATVPDGWLGAVGVVVDEQNRMDYRGSASDGGYVHIRTPIVRFAAVDGTVYAARSLVEGTIMPRPGATVTVYYDPAYPNHARVGAESLPRMNRVFPRIAATIAVVIVVPLAAIFEFLGYLVVSA